MAFYKKLTEGWRLSDGILPESLMEKPMSVYEALRDAGRVPDAEMSLNAMECEWIAAREWTYSLLLDAPEEDDERVYIELPKIWGTGKAYLNGEEIGSLHSGSVRLDLTGAMKEGENLIELRFAPGYHVRPDMIRPLPETGLACAPVLRTVNFALVEQMSISSRRDGKDGIIEAELSVNAFTGGKYLFTYGVMLDGEPAGRFEFTEKLKAAKQTIRHEIRVENASLLDKKRLEETIYSVKFTLERGGVGCDVRHMETAFRTGEALRCAAVKEWPVSGDAIDRAMEMGADGIVLSGQPENAFEKNDFLGGLTVVEDGARSDAPGMLTAEEMTRYASGVSIWPMDGAAWKLRGGKRPGPVPPAGTDAAAYAKAIRFRQAAQVLLGAQLSRKDGKRAIYQLDEEFAYYASDALMEKGGAARPAMHALKRAWTEAHAFCELPDGGRAKPDRLLQLNVWALAEALRGSILSVAVTVMDESGQTLASASYPVMGGDVRLAGVIEVRTPQKEGLLIVRCEMHEVRGGMVSRADGVLLVEDAQEMSAVWKAGQAKLSGMSGKRANGGDTAAFSAGLCLMPGEETECTEIEYFNA